MNGSKKCLIKPARLLLIGILVFSLFFTEIPKNSHLAFAQQEPEKLLPDGMKDKLPYFSGMPMLIAAKSLGITKIEGKGISAGRGPPGNAKTKKLKDVGVGINATQDENEPTVVANPKDKKKLVAGSHFFGPPDPADVRCVAYTSSDSGATWSAPFMMPQLTPASVCSDPVLAYAPDGSRVYYAYMDIKVPSQGGFDIVVSFSDDNGKNWIGPKIALDGIPPAFYDKPWIGTHIDESQSNWVYITATNFTLTANQTAFTRSSNKGASWSAPVILDNGMENGVGVLVQGSRPAGGVGGEVLVAWYNSRIDGWLNGSFKIRTARSGDHGATFDPPVDATVDSFETPFFLGPSNFYHLWWTTMFPDVKIDSGGKAHIVYTHDPVDPVADPSTLEDGDIRYTTSPGPPYNAWSSPVTVNDDHSGRAQGFAALETQHGGQSSSLHAIWEDHRLSPNLTTAFPNSPNLFYDIFYSRKVPGQGWFRNFRVSDASSISDFIFIGDYNGLAANDRLLFGIWTDRRHQTSIFDLEDNVFGSRIIAGGGTP